MFHTDVLVGNFGLDLEFSILKATFILKDRSQENQQRSMGPTVRVWVICVGGFLLLAQRSLYMSAR